MTTTRVTGWVERIGDKTGVRTLHLVDTRGKRVCRCAYDMGEKPFSNRKSTYYVDAQAIKRDQHSERLYIERTHNTLTPDVVLCEKSGIAFAKDLQRLGEFQHGPEDTNQPDDEGAAKG